MNAKIGRVQWWHCPMPGCPYKQPDDFSVAAAQRIGEHVAVHEAKESKQERLKVSLNHRNRVRNAGA